jgi:hypothetical protein
MWNLLRNLGASGTIAAALTPKDKRSKLEIARDNLAEDDKVIISLLSHFKPASAPQLLPDQAYLADYMKKYPFPGNIEEIAIVNKTPVSLIAGVAQFLTRKSIEENPDKFEELTKAIAKRFNDTWLVVEHKEENRQEFEDENGFVNCFVQDQHDRVARDRATQFAQDVMQKNSSGNKGVIFSVSSGTVSVANQNIPDDSSFPELSRNVINFLAATGAGWQSEGINHKIGPYSTRSISDSLIFRTFPSYPTELKAA